MLVLIIILVSVFAFRHGMPRYLLGDNNYSPVLGLVDEIVFLFVCSFSAVDNWNFIGSSFLQYVGSGRSIDICYFWFAMYN